MNEIPSFHVTRNYAVDVMYDFPEGIIPLEVKLTLDKLIKDGHFSLEEVNNRISSFSYGFIDKKNVPSPIKESGLSNPGGSSGQTAAQMNCLIKYLPLILGDLVPTTSDVWEMLLLLIDIYKIIMAPMISKSGTVFLRQLIHDHHNLFLELFPERNLIPKHHYVTHYPRIIQLIGPVPQYSSLRKEGKHKPFKKWANACNNYQNITKTVANRHQQQQSFVFLKQYNTECEINVKHQIPVQVSTLQGSDEVCSLAVKQTLSSY